MQAKPTLFVLLVGLFSASFISKAQQSANPLDARSTITGQPTLPSQPGNALVYIYRSGSVVGAANHPRLFVNEVFVGDLHVSNYISREVPSGTVLFSFLPKSTVNLTLYQALANNLTKKKKDVLQADVEAGRAYYFKWSYGGFGGFHPLKPVDATTGAKEITTLHPANQ